MSKPKPDVDEFELRPDFFYRKHSPVALGVIGLGTTQIDEALDRGELPPLVDATDSGRACGWYGFQLIELQRQRLAKAEAAAAERQAKQQQEEKGPRNLR